MGLLAAILLLAGAFRLAVINLPFERNYEGCGAFFALVARNYFRYDFATTLGVPVMSQGQGATPHFYANHPPTTALLIAAVHGLMGYDGNFEHLPGEWQARLPTVLFTLGCIIAVFVVLAQRGAPRAGLIAAAMLASIPMTLIYGGFPDVINPQLVLMALLTLCAYERFHRRPGWASLALLAAAFAGAAVMDWPAFYLGPVMGVHYLFTRRPRQWGWIVGLGIISVGIFIGLYAQLAVVQEDWAWMRSQVERRALSGAGDGEDPFTLANWLHRAVVLNVFGRQTPIVAGLALIWLALARARRWTHPADRIATLLLAWAGIHILIGRQGVYQHEWWWWPLTPGLILAAALAADELLLMLQRRWSPRSVNILASAALAAFATVNTYRALREIAQPTRIDAGPLNYSLVELGQVIRESSTPDEGVMLAESDESLALWYYADRPLKRRIWSLRSFERRLDDGYADLSFDAYRKWSGHVGAMIVPKVYISPSLRPLVDGLDARYRRRETDKFLVYDVRNPK